MGRKRKRGRNSELKKKGKYTSKQEEMARLIHVCMHLRALELTQNNFVGRNLKTTFEQKMGRKQR